MLITNWHFFNFCIALPGDVREALSTWYRCRTQSTLAEKHGDTATKLIERELASSPQLRQVYDKKDLFFKLALWILGSENWANDLQYSGIHHVVSTSFIFSLFYL